MKIKENSMCHVTNRINQSQYTSYRWVSVCVIIMCLFLFSTDISAQYTNSNSIIRRAIVRYEKDGRGFYHKVEGGLTEEVNNCEDVYAFDTKASNLYVRTFNANYEITLNKDYAKIIKKNKNIPHLKSEQLASAIDRANFELEKRFLDLNRQRQAQIEADSLQHIQDSIATAKRLEALRLEAENKKKEYVSTHEWREIPINDVKIECLVEDCGYSTYSNSFIPIGISNDTIYFATNSELALDVSYLTAHYAKIPEKLKNDKDFKFHCEAFRDSLTIKNDDWNLDKVHGFNFYTTNEAIETVEKKAPYGFFEDWGWGNEYGAVTFHFIYRNTNKKTIKYIDVYWVIKNDVGDLRKSGHFSGTGPLEYLSGASWNWDYSGYYVGGDASKMTLTKVIITYTDGSKRTLTKDMIMYD